MGGQGAIDWILGKTHEEHNFIGVSVCRHFNVCITPLLEMSDYDTPISVYAFR